MTIKTVDANNAFVVEEPEWGEKIVLGDLFGREQYVSRPMNQTAVNSISRDVVLAIMLHDKIGELEARLKRLEDRAVTSPESL